MRVALLLVGCAQGSGLDFGKAPEVLPPHASDPTVGPVDDGSDPSSTAPSEGDADTDTDTDADTDTDTDADVDTDPPPVTTGGTLPLEPPEPGVFEGTIVIDYEMTVPLIGGSSTCTGPMTVTYDPAAPDALVGSWNCDWPLFDLWAAVVLSSMDGQLRGDPIPGGYLVDGSIGGEDGTGTFVVDDPFDGALAGTLMVGAFSGGSFLVDDYSGSWTLTWQGP